MLDFNDINYKTATEMRMESSTIVSMTSDVGIEESVITTSTSTEVIINNTEDNVLCGWSSVRYENSTSKFEFFDALGRFISYTEDEFRAFIDNDLFKIGRCLSKTSLERVNVKNGDLLRKNAVVPTRGGYTRNESKARRETMTSLFDMNNGDKMTTLLPLTKQFLEMEGNGYCMLRSAYNLHPSMTVADAVIFASKHEDEDRGGSLVRVIKPNDLVGLIHDFCNDFFFKCIHAPHRNRNSTNEETIKKIIAK